LSHRAALVVWCLGGALGWSVLLALIAAIL
jgi:hypothetical protein